MPRSSCRPHAEQVRRDHADYDDTSEPCVQECAQGPSPQQIVSKFAGRKSTHTHTHITRRSKVCNFVNGSKSTSISSLFPVNITERKFGNGWKASCKREGGIGSRLPNASQGAIGNDKRRSAGCWVAELLFMTCEQISQPGSCKCCMNKGEHREPHFVTQTSHFLACCQPLGNETKMCLGGKPNSMSSPYAHWTSPGCR